MRVCRVKTDIKDLFADMSYSAKLGGSLHHGESDLAASSTSTRSPQFCLSLHIITLPQPFPHACIQALKAATSTLYPSINGMFPAFSIFNTSRCNVVPSCCSVSMFASKDGSSELLLADRKVWWKLKRAGLRSAVPKFCNEEKRFSLLCVSVVRFGMALSGNMVCKQSLEAVTALMCHASTRCGGVC